LSDLDPKNWKERDNDGVLRDPWVKQWYLPLTSNEIGDLVTFVTGSAGGDDAITSLCRVYGNRRDGLLPIVALKAGSYKHKRYGRIETPDFDIVGWFGTPTAKPVPETGNAGGNDDMNDAIPF
jgi:hypothetical protein